MDREKAKLFISETFPAVPQYLFYFKHSAQWIDEMKVPEVRTHQKYHPLPAVII